MPSFCFGVWLTYNDVVQFILFYFWGHCGALELAATGI